MVQGPLYNLLLLLLLLLLVVTLVIIDVVVVIKQQHDAPLHHDSTLISPRMALLLGIHIPNIFSDIQFSDN